MVQVSFRCGWPRAHARTHARLARMQAVLLLWMAVLAVGAEEWSFRDFLQGDWNLERSSAGQAFRAHYSFKEVNGDPARLEGKYHEEGEMGPTNEMVVRVLFSDASGRNGQFQLAKARAPEPAWTGDEDVPPVPQAQPEPKTAFEFAFRSQSDGRFQLSESNWLGKAGGAVRFLIADEDAFVFSKVACAEASPQLTEWTATREGAAPKRASKSAGGQKKSLLQRYGWYIGLAILYFAWKASKSSGAAKKAA